MRRRLTLATLGLVAGALILAGVGTLVITRQSARDQAVSQILSEAQALAAIPAVDRSGASKSAIGQTFRKIARVADIEVVRLRVDGSIASGTLPQNVTLADVKPQQLLSGNATSGTTGSLAYAAAPTALQVEAPRLRAPVPAYFAVVITRELGNLGPSWSYFLLVGGIALGIAAIVGYGISRRISRPLVHAVSVTQKIAAGDLDAQVPVSRGDYKELVSLADSINTMAARLSRARGMERQFLLSVSHDLRTPLTSIRGFAEAIAEGAAPDAQRAATVIASESRRLERLVQDLLELAKLDSRRFSLEMRPVDGGQVVPATAEGFRPLVEKSGLSLDVAVPDDSSLWVRADPDRLAQITANLVENAFNYARSAIVVTASAGAGRVLFTVEDDGPGIAPADLDHSFDRMFQPGRTPARRAGSGLGLTIVAELAGAMAAGVGAESPINRAGGTRMVVSFPQLASGSSSTRPPARPPGQAASTEAGGTISLRT